ncbi:hypothetical protein GCM10010358_68240 [Streptomyces minutiscleroticus]|uniref:Uncharacterized protein n=1 Tax=Streptomyces minutiscleroticus TaxID=68238 RepID=A0A918NXX1_9ACTN|nr:hypothetical protein [Streptomyces minutiscleroticus]GGY05196.1 hypothetical protein GCM10010358_68240 [Streptomyces minutiscleroticus]
MVITPITVVAARAYAREMSGCTLPQPSPANVDDGVLTPAHETAFFLGMAETFRILIRPGIQPWPGITELSAAAQAASGGGLWYRRGDEAARRIVTSDRQIRTLPQDPDQLWALLADVLQALEILGQAPQLDGSNQRRSNLPGRPPAIRSTPATGNWEKRVEWNPDGACRWSATRSVTWQWPGRTPEQAQPDVPDGQTRARDVLEQVLRKEGYRTGRRS